MQNLNSSTNRLSRDSQYYHPLQVVLPYVIVSTLWILFSDSVLSIFIHDADEMAALSIYKGLGFVITTGALLYVLVRRYTTRLETSLSRFRILFDTMTQGVIYNDEKGVITLANPAAEKFLGQEGGVLRGRAITTSFQNAIHEDGSPFPPDQLPALTALQTGQPANDVIIGLPHSHPAHYHWLVVNALPVFRPGAAKPYQVYTTLTDITEQKKIEAALRDSEARYHHILDSMMEGCQIVDFDWRFVYVNDTLAQQGRYTPEQLLNHTMMEMYPGIEDTDLFQILRRCMTDRVPQRIENQFQFPDGSVGWFELSIQPAHEGIFILSTDITERKRAELALQEAREHLEQRVQERTAEVQDLYDNAPAGYHSLDVQGNFVNINQTELDWLGYRREEVVGKMNIIDILTAESQKEFAVLFPQFKKEGQLRNIEFDLLCKDGTILPVAINATGIYDAAGNYVMSRTTVFDMTERKRTEVRLRLANAELIRAATLKDQFLSSMSHELRTPLNGILSLTEALEEGVYGELTPRQLDALRIVAESGQHLLTLINDILDLSKIEAGKMELQLVSLKVDDICQKSLALIRSSALQKGLRVHYSVSSVLETLAADERHLKQMLVNLLGNVVKFTPEGGQIGLEVSGNAAAETICFTVWDTGIGIAAAKLPLLFQPFSQLDSSLSRQYSGSGLGLSLVRRLAELHGGYVTVESEPGTGSRFHIHLPLNNHDDAAATPPDTATHHPGKQVRGRTALIVEDSDAISAQLTRYLHDLSLRVIIEETGQKVVERAALLQPDIILLDILMPGISGWDVLDALKADARTQVIPVIVVSVVDEPAQSLAAGAATHLVKPVTKQILQASVSRVLLAHDTVPLRPAQEPALSPAPPTETDHQAPLILLAEDNEVNQQSLSDYLIAKGYRVIAAMNGAEAITQAQQFKPDLILMDIQMPQMDGLEAIRCLRAMPEFAHTPIIALTALAMSGDRERCLEAGATDYLTKPVSLKALMRVIEMLGRGRG